MNKQRRVGRRSVVMNLVKPIPSKFENEHKVSKGPKRALFTNDASFTMNNSSKSLNEKNNFQYSSTKSKSHDNLYQEKPCEILKYPFTNMANKNDKIILSPPDRNGHFESSMVKNHREPNEPIWQSTGLFNSLIDSPCTKFQKLQYNNAKLSASKIILNRHLKTVQQNADAFFKEKSEVNSLETNEKPSNEHKTSYLNDSSITPKENVYQIDCEKQISLFIDEIKELKKSEVEDIRQSKLHCRNIMKTLFKEMEVEIENHFGKIESKLTENFNQLLKKNQDKKNECADLQTLDTTVETVKEKNYARTIGEEIRNQNADCKSLKIPKIKDKTGEKISTQSDLTPGTMSFVFQEQLAYLNNNS